MRLLALVLLAAQVNGPRPPAAPILTDRGAPLIRSFSPGDMEPPGERSGPQVFSIAQDSRGVVFVANSAGVLEHDGVGWRVHTLPTKSTPLSLGIDAAGTLFVGAGDDFGLFETGPAGALRFRSLRSLVPPGAPPIRDVWQVLPAADGVWFRTEAALYRYHDGRVDVVPARTKLKIGGTAAGITVVRELDTALLKLENGRAVPLPGGEALAKEKIYFYVSLDGRRLLAGSRRGLFLFDPATGLVEPFRTEVDAELEKAEVYAGALLPDGALAVGTSWKGVYVLDREGRLVAHLDRAAGLPDDEVFTLFVDRDGALWVGLNNGMARIELPSPLSWIGERHGLTGFVEAMARGRDGLYLATSTGVVRLRPGTRGALLDRIPGISEMTWDVAAMGDLVLAATDDGLFSISPGEGPGRVTKLRGDAHRQVHPSARRPGLVALGVGDGLVVAELVDGRLRGERRIGGIAEPGLRVVEAPDGTLWVGTESRGIYRVRLDGTDGASVDHFKAGPSSGHGLAPGYAYPFLLDGEVVVGTINGLRRLDPRAARLPRGDPGEPGSGLRPPDPPGGGFVPDPRLGEALAYGSIDAFRVEQDLAGRVFVRAGRTTSVLRRGPAGYRSDPGPVSRLPGRLDVRAFLTEPGTGTNGADITWIGTHEGLFRVDWGIPRFTSPDIRCLVRRVTSSGRDVLFDGAGAPDLRLPFTRGALRFEYASPAFEEPSATRYRAWLDGFEEPGVTPSEETRRDFTNLPEGSYRFRVTAVDLLGRTAGDASIPLVVLPPWYRTTWAYGLFTLLAAAGVSGLVRLRLRTLRRRTRELEEAVLARTGELHDSNRRLSDAQARIAELVESTREAQEDVSAWARMTGVRIAGAIAARAVDAYALDGDSVEPLSAAKGAPAPARAALDDALAASRAFRERTSVGPVPEEIALAARGASGEVVGALLARGVTAWGDTERRLLEGYAHQLGGALEMRRMRRQLAAAEAARTAVRSDMERRGIVTLRVCPRCQRCYGSTATTCEADGRPLEAPRLLPHRLLDRYRLDRVLGEGGMGTVFLARDERLDREVAIKVIRPERFDDPASRVRFEREAHTIARISHPGVVALHDSGTLPDGSAFLVMERLHGMDLGAVLDRYGRGSPRQVARLARQGGAALAAAHRAGVVHRDVKPENVVLTPAPGGFLVKVVDFGLAKEMSVRDGLTRTGMVVGTPWYMAPEQLEGAPVSGRSDLYSFAMILYEALTGSRPADSASLGEVLDHVLRTSPPPPSGRRPGLSAEVDARFAEAFRKDPAARPDDVEAWAAALADALEKATGPDRGWPEPIASPA